MKEPGKKPQPWRARAQATQWDPPFWHKPLGDHEGAVKSGT